VSGFSRTPGLPGNALERDPRVAEEDVPRGSIGDEVDANALLGSGNEHDRLKPVDRNDLGLDGFVGAGDATCEVRLQPHPVVAVPGG